MKLSLLECRVTRVVSMSKSAADMFCDISCFKLDLVFVAIAGSDIRNRTPTTPRLVYGRFLLRCVLSLSTLFVVQIFNVVDFPVTLPVGNSSQHSPDKSKRQKQKEHDHALAE